MLFVPAGWLCPEQARAEDFGGVRLTLVEKARDERMAATNGWLRSGPNGGKPLLQSALDASMQSGD